MLILYYIQRDVKFIIITFFRTADWTNITDFNGVHIFLVWQINTLKSEYSKGTHSLLSLSYWLKD